MTAVDGMDPELSMTDLEGVVQKSRASKQVITISAIPGEGLAIAAMNMMTAIIEYAMVERTTMDPALLARKDAVTVASLARGERFIAHVEGLLPK